MTRFQDPRAAELTQQIDQINATGWEGACDLALQQHVVKGELSPVETVLRFDMFRKRAQDTQGKRQAIWAEQVSQGISGIEWYTFEYGGMTVELPRLCEELTLVPGDKEILVQSKSVALDFLAHWNMVFKLWRYNRETDERWLESRWSQFYAEYISREWVEVWLRMKFTRSFYQMEHFRTNPRLPSTLAVVGVIQKQSTAPLHTLILAQAGFNGIILHLGDKSDCY
jgi:hypothetical protein